MSICRCRNYPWARRNLYCILYANARSCKGFSLIGSRLSYEPNNEEPFFVELLQIKSITCISSSTTNGKLRHCFVVEQILEALIQNENLECSTLRGVNLSIDAANHLLDNVLWRCPKLRYLKIINLPPSPRQNNPKVEAFLFLA